MTNFAITAPAGWSELPYGQSIIIGEIATSYASMLKWSSQYRTAQGIKPIDEMPIPEGKVPVGESRIEDQDGKPAKVWDLEDAPEPVIVIPESVTMRQARLALLGAGVLDAAEAAVAAMTGPEGRAAQIEWEYATELRRDHPLIAGIGVGLNLDDAAIDALFTQAALIA